MDVNQALQDTENSLRDFIAAILNESLGENWITKCGVSKERIEKWKERKEIEEKRQDTGTAEERLIYYADFYDLKTILQKNWSGEFSNIFGDWKTTEVYLNILEKYRDAEAHRRELFPHQKNLIIGISGEIRNKLTRYRSKKETGDDVFPQIESVRDNLGNMWIPGKDRTIATSNILRPGDILEFVVTASDPEGLELKYQIMSETAWQKENNFRILIVNKHIGKMKQFIIRIRSLRDYHAYDSIDGGCDDVVIFDYQVLPKKVNK
jgi:hypothetical protein